MSTASPRGWRPRDWRRCRRSRVACGLQRSSRSLLNARMSSSAQAEVGPSNGLTQTVDHIVTAVEALATAGSRLRRSSVNGLQNRLCLFGSVLALLLLTLKLCAHDGLLTILR